MNALLEVPEIRRQVFALPVERYHRLTDGLKTELLRGTIFQKMSKSPAHQYFADRLRVILSTQISPELILRPDSPISTADSEPEPDLSVVRGPLEMYRHTHATTAELIAEIAVTSLEIDRAKAGIYAEAGVKEYWIVCPEQKQVEVYRGPRVEGYAERSTVAAPAVLECAALPGVKVDIAALFA